MINEEIQCRGFSTTDSNPITKDDMAPHDATIWAVQEK